jgi:hypothetical protein
MTDTNTAKSAAKKPRTFDVNVTSKMITEGLAKLKAEQKPGQVIGTGSKEDVLKMHEQAIKELHELGYTAKQIASAISNDTFNILPKTITQLINPNKRIKTAPKAPKSAPKAKESVFNKIAKKPVDAASATFNVQPDELV